MATVDPHVAAVLAAVRRWNSTHGRSQQIDPQAELAVARQEGLSGGIGDNGTSFGPNQEHAGGALPASVYARGRDYAQAWAWSPAGLEHALAGIARYAGGETGARAVADIVSRFERPANPQREIARALQALGLPVPSTSGLPLPPGADGSTQPGTGLSALLQGAFNSNNALLGVPSIDLTAPPAAVISAAPAAANAPATEGGQIAELLREGTGGPTHSTGPHLHFAATTAAAMLAAIKYAQQLGLSARENPYTGDTVDPVHAKHSYHYRRFPGLYNGRPLGQATDFSGDPAAVNSLYSYIQTHFGA